MRIVQACPYAWDAPGGVQVHVRNLAPHLRARGHDVLVLAPGRTRTVEPGVRIVGRSMPIPYNGSIAPICPSLGSARVIKWTLEEFRPDVIHVHEPFTPSTSMFATLRANAPVVATFHAFAERSLLLTVASPALRLVLRKIDTRVAVSNVAASFASKQFGGEFEIIPNGVDVGLFRNTVGRPQPGPSLLFVNRLDRRKGFAVAVEAFGLLAERHPDLQLVVVGDGEERDAIFGLEPSARARVHLLGTVTHEALPQHYADADIFLAPARGGESFGIVLVEAMAAGLPIVASAIPGYDEVVRDGREGLLVPPGDPRALADGVERVLSDPELALRLRQAGSRRAEEFDWERLAERIEKVYERTLGD
jgi:phosphatidylinositol alpha-mannosyltransferase